MRPVGIMGNLKRRGRRPTSRTYLCIDLKSFYASVECVERGLDPMTTLLAVADSERTEKTICLAITPAMKALGIKNRCRVFEIPDSVDYIMATPRMHLYLQYSARIYGIYLKYIAKEDIHVYSVDEAFLDVTNYLSLYGLTARELGVRIMQDIYDTTGITATCGIGTNLFLTKVALDITAKHVPDHIGYLNEERYRRTLWQHLPLTDFWMVGHATERRLLRYGIHTMRDITRADENLLYREFGVNAELLIDHAWGVEPVTIADIHRYRPQSRSVTAGQVLPRDYSYDEGLLLMKEMTDQLCLRLCDGGLISDSLTMYVGYSRTFAERTGRGRSDGTISMDRDTCLTTDVLPKTEELYRRIALPEAPIRRVGLCFNRVEPEGFLQYTLFDDPVRLEKQHALQRTVSSLQKRYGRSTVIRAMDLSDAGRTLERNEQIGGHRA